MLNRKTSGSIRDKAGLDYNDKEQLENAIYNANFAIECLKSEIKENKKYIKVILIRNLSELMSLVRNTSQYVKYKKDVNALKTRIKQMDVKEFLSDLSMEDVIAFMQVLNELCLIEMSDAKLSKENAFTKTDVLSDDVKYYYVDGNGDNINVSKSAYYVARAKGGIKYGACMVGSKVLNGGAKVLSMFKDKGI